MGDRNRIVALCSAASQRMALRARNHFARRALALWRDTDGLMVPYVAVMLPVLVGFALLWPSMAHAVCVCRTQMQAAADSLALAGARELNKQAGAEARAISAMANAHAAEKSSNTLFGVGASPVLAYTFVFYSSLSAASGGIGGSVASGDLDAKYVAVKITPQTWSTILPATFLANISTNAFAIGADAVAGFAGRAFSVAPVFVCNPYEESGGSMTDAQATEALYSAFATRRFETPTQAQQGQRRSWPFRLAEYGRRLRRRDVHGEECRRREWRLLQRCGREPRSRQQKCRRAIFRHAF